MIRKALISVAGTALLLAIPAMAQAQVRGPSFFVSAGGSTPMGGFDDVANLGFMGNAGVRVPVGDRGLYLGAEGFFGRHSHESTGANTKLFGGLGNVTYRLGDPDRTGVYLIGSTGVVWNRLDLAGPTRVPTEALWGYGGGLGVEVPLGAVGLRAEARYIGTSGNVQYLPILIGVSFGGNR